MPILRADETPDLVGQNLIYLWQRKWWIIIPTLTVFVLTYLGMRFVAEEYKVTAAIYVNKLTLNPDNDQPLSPATAVQLLESAMLLHKVRDEYMREFGLERAPQLEKFIKRFSAKTEILQDTSVRKEISPVVNLSVQSDGTSPTRFLMESWLRNFIAEYGNVATSEAILKRDTLDRENSFIEREMQALETSRSLVRTQLALKEKLLAQKMDILAPAELPRQPVRPDRMIESDSINRNGGDSTVQVSINAQPKPAGLLSRLADVQVSLSRSQSGGAGTSPTTELQSEASAITNVIRDTETSITELQASTAGLQAELARLDREADYRGSMQARLQNSINRFAVNAAMEARPTNMGMPAGADIRVVSMPTTPELRIWPKRTFAAGGAALAAAFIITVALLLHRYLQLLALRNSNVA